MDFDEYHRIIAIVPKRLLKHILLNKTNKYIIFRPFNTFIYDHDFSSYTLVICFNSVVLINRGMKIYAGNQEIEYTGTCILDDTNFFISKLKVF